MTATGTTTFYSHPFYEWASANVPDAGTAISFTSDVDRDNQPDGISWALGFEAGAPTKQLEHSLNPDTGELTFALPGPTRADLALQQSTTLESADWTDVPGFDSIPAGRTEPIVLSVTVAPKRFYRFATSLD